MGDGGWWWVGVVVAGRGWWLVQGVDRAKSVIGVAKMKPREPNL